MSSSEKEEISSDHSYFADLSASSSTEESSSSFNIKKEARKMKKYKKREDKNIAKSKLKGSDNDL